MADLRHLRGSGPVTLKPAMDVTARPKPKLKPLKPFRFLDLPAELRLRIYDFALRDLKYKQRIRLHHFWYTPPSALYQTRSFMGLAQVNRTIRKEFPPEKYHTYYCPEIAYAEWPLFSRAFPFMSSSLPFDLPGTLAALEAAFLTNTDILPVVQIDWTAQPYTVRNRADSRTGSKRCLHVCSCLHKYTDDLAIFDAIRVKASVGLVVVTLVLKEGVSAQADMQMLKEVFEKMLGWSGLMRNQDARVVCESGELTFCADGHRQRMRAQGVWTTRAGHRVGEVWHY